MPRQISGIRARLEYTGALAMVRILAAMPLERAIRVGAHLGRAAMEIDRPNRPIAIKNLEIAFPEMAPDARIELIRGVYRNWGRMLAEWAHMDRLDRSNIERYVTYEGKEYWDEAERMSNGRGLLVLTAHFDNWELLNVAHSVYGYRIAIVHRPLRNPLMDRLVCAARTRCGNALIARKAGALEMARMLRKNWQIAVALDLDVRQGVFVDFFGMPAATSDGVARLAAVSGAPVVPCFLVRQDGSAQHKITILPPIEIVRGGSRADDIRENTQRFTRVIEDMIRRHPDQWNWIHRRWKTRPPGDERFY
jgi:Kdo2-lipid IVA lauroyltransferase/acyltransferase